MISAVQLLFMDKSILLCILRVEGTVTERNKISVIFLVHKMQVIMTQFYVQKACKKNAFFQMRAKCSEVSFCMSILSFRRRRRRYH
jgi:hypothetical protein